jgi:hypothetical protein
LADFAIFTKKYVLKIIHRQRFKKKKEQKEKMAGRSYPHTHSLLVAGSLINPLLWICG